MKNKQIIVSNEGEYPKNDLFGNRYGRWLVTGWAGRRIYGKDHHNYWYCLCDCGVRRIVDGNSLLRGFSRSCKCLQRELMRKRMKAMYTRLINDDKIISSYEMAYRERGLK